MEQQSSSKNFFEKAIRSVYGPEYYQELLDKPFSYSVKYFATFVALVAFILFLGFSFLFFPKMNTALNAGVRMAVDNYPQDLVVTVKSGNISINKEEPYFVKLPDLMNDGNRQSNKIENLIAVDTKSEASADNLKKYNTVALVTKNYIVYQKDDGQISIQSLENISDMVVDKIAVTNFVEKYSPYLKLLYPFFIIVFFIFFVLLILFRLCYLFLAALLIWLIAHIKNVEISYGKSYQLGLHLITLPLLLFSPFFHLVYFPFNFTLLLVILAFVNIRKKDGGTVLAPTESVQAPEVKKD